MTCGNRMKKPWQTLEEEEDEEEEEGVEGEDPRNAGEQMQCVEELAGMTFKQAVGPQAAVAALPPLPLAAAEIGTGRGAAPGLAMLNWGQCWRILGGRGRRRTEAHQPSQLHGEIMAHKHNSQGRNSLFCSLEFICDL